MKPKMFSVSCLKWKNTRHTRPPTGGLCFPVQLVHPPLIPDFKLYFFWGGACLCFFLGRFFGFSSRIQWTHTRGICKGIDVPPLHTEATSPLWSKDFQPVGFNMFHIFSFYDILWSRNPAGQIWPRQNRAAPGWQTSLVRSTEIPQRTRWREHEAPARTHGSSSRIGLLPSGSHWMQQYQLRVHRCSTSRRWP